jgi:S-(hydroxymethyl)glutathione dehydrogenase/alcohol dehydrogenase
MKGIVVRNGKVTIVDDLEVKEPDAHEVTVRVLASGLCRSDLLPIDEPFETPMVLGHEAAGIIEKVGSRVVGLTRGQRVAVSCSVPCGNCSACAKKLYTACPDNFGIGLAPFTLRGEPVLSLARVSSLAELITVDASQIHPVENLDASAASLIGCAVSTGYGMTKNVVKLQKGESVLVIGVGGIGINSTQTAKLLGASRVVAADINPDKESTALQFGADTFVLLEQGQSWQAIVSAVKQAVGEMFDAVIDCSGQPSSIEAAQYLLKPGGRVGLVGIPHGGATAALNITGAMYNHITVSGALNGACNPFEDLPEIVRLAESGSLNLADQVSHRWPLEKFEEAFEALRSGRVLRAVIDVQSVNP